MKLASIVVFFSVRNPQPTPARFCMLSPLQQPTAVAVPCLCSMIPQFFLAVTPPSGPFPPPTNHNLLWMVPPLMNSHKLPISLLALFLFIRCSMQLLEYSSLVIEEVTELNLGFLSTQAYWPKYMSLTKSVPILSCGGAASCGSSRQKIGRSGRG